MRQVQLGAGVMVLLGMGLGTFVSPWFYLISAFVGAGLTVAGATGYCGMALALMRMPWNRLPAAAAGPAGGTCDVGGAAAPGCQASVAPSGTCSAGGGGQEAPPSARHQHEG